MIEMQHIEDDFSIPQELEFREEYLKDAMHLYSAAKKRIFLKKVSVIAVSVAAILVLSVCICMNTSGEHTSSELNATDLEQSQPASTALMPDENSEADGNVTSFPVMDELNRSADDQNIITGQYQDNSSFELETSGSGGPVSSGAGLPDHESVVYSGRSGDRTADGLAGQYRQENEVIPIEDLADASAVVLKKEDGQVTMKASDYAVVTDEQENFSTIPALELNSVGVHLLPVPFKGLHRAKPVDSKIIRRWIPFVYAGLIALTDYGSAKWDMRLDPIVGTGVHYLTKNHLLLGTSVSYRSVSGLSHPYVVEQIYYDQGFQRTTFTYYTGKLHYAGLAVQAGKRFNRRNEVAIGYAIEYLLTGENTVHQGMASSLTSEQQNSSNTRGYVDGFRSVNHGLSLDYRFWLDSNKALGVNAQFGLSDITKDQYFKSAEVHRNSYLAVYFRMNLRR